MHENGAGRLPQQLSLNDESSFDGLIAADVFGDQQNCVRGYDRSRAGADSQLESSIADARCGMASSR